MDIAYGQSAGTTEQSWLYDLSTGFLTRHTIEWHLDELLPNVGGQCRDPNRRPEPPDDVHLRLGAGQQQHYPESRH